MNRMRKNISLLAFFIVLLIGGISVNADANEPPYVVVPIIDQYAAPGESFIFTVPPGTFADPDGDPLTYAADNPLLPTWMTFDPETATFSGTPSQTDKESRPVMITAKDPEGFSASTVFNVVVTDTPPEPLDGIWYADINKGRDDMTYDGTQEKPWKTLHYAISQIEQLTSRVDGSMTLNIEPGVYSLANGERDSALKIGISDLTLRTSAGKVILSGKDAQSWHIGIHIDQDASNVTVTDVVLTDFIQTGIRIEGTGNQVSGCEIYDNGIGVEIQNRAAGNSVYNNDVFSTANPPAAAPVHGVSVEYAGDGNDIRYNRIYGYKENARSAVNITDSSPLISENRFYNNFKAIFAEGRSPRIWNNLIYGDPDVQFFGIYVSGSDASPLIYHNTLVGADDITAEGDWDNYAIYIYGGSPEIKYNIIKNFKYGIYNDGASVADYNNVWNKAADAENYINCAPGSHGISEDPLFEDPANDDYRLRNDSPCNDTIPSSAGDPVTTDIAGTARPVGAGYDMGCYESETVKPYKLTVSVPSAGGGKITAECSDASGDCGINCPENCEAYYTPNSEILLNASPESGYMFERWEGDMEEAGNPAALVMDSDKNITAIFKPVPPQQYSLTVSVSDEAGGTVSGSGIDCPGDCNESYDFETEINLTASPKDGFRFDHWEGSLSGSGNPIGVVMDSNKEIRAVFEPISQQQYTLNISISDEAGGTVSGAGIDCPGDCSEVYDADTAVILSAAPKDGFRFDRWEGSMRCFNNPTSIVMDSDKEMKAIFEPVSQQQYTLNISLSNEQGGTVSGAGIECPDDCSETYDAGTSPELTAHAADGYQFAFWKWEEQGEILKDESNPIRVDMDSDRDIKAVFEVISIQQYTLTISVSQGGTVSGAGIDCPDDCSETYDAGTSAELTADAAAGYYFAFWKWEEAGEILKDESNPIRIDMDSDREIKAVFRLISPQQYTLNVSVSDEEAGTVSGSGIDCPNDCSEIYDAGISLTLKAVAESGYLFDHWEGKLTGSDNPGSMVIDSDKAVKAVFISEPDTTPPSVVSVTPADAATNTALNTEIIATFSNPLNDSTVTTDTFFVRGASGISISGTVSYDEANWTATFAPDALDYGITYKAVITTGVEDLSENPLKADFEWSFTTMTEPDISPPEIVSVVPADGQTDAALNTEIRVRFSEPVNISTITAETVFIRDSSGTKIHGSVVYDEANMTATFTPDILDYGTTYNAVITTGVKDLEGNSLQTDFEWSFTTMTEPDTVPPEIISVVPADGQTDLALDTEISIQFSEAVNVSTITLETLTVLNESGSTVGGTVTYDEANMTVIFTPDALNYGTVYNIVITTGVKDSAGNALQADFEWSFATISEPDTVPPEIISVVPADGQRDVALNTEIIIVFSEPMNASTITPETVFVSDESGGRVDGLLNYDEANMTVIFTPDALNYGTTYNAVITADIKDLAGNPIQADFEWSFSTITASDTVPPEIISVLPAPGGSNISLNTEIMAVFSEPLNLYTVTNETFLVLDESGMDVLGSVFYNEVNMTAIFTPDTLDYGKTYTAVITAGVKDLAGNSFQADFEWSFRTIIQPDMLPPQIISVVPAEGESNLALDAEIAAVFSEPVNALTVKPETFFVSDESGNSISGTVNYDRVNTRAIFTPDDLDYGTTYTAVITTGVKDLGGNPLQADFEWSFTTMGEPDTVPPEIISVVPADGETDLRLDTKISAVFSESMNVETITAETFFVSDESGISISGTINYDEASLRATFTPDNLDYSTTYIAVLTGGVKDAAGNSLQTAFEWSFAIEERDSGNPPDTPLAASPPDEAVIDADSISLQGGDFSDPDGDEHTETRWLVKRFDRMYDDPEYDASFDYTAVSGNLTAHIVSGLYPGLKYVWKLGYKDAGSGETAWSEERTFKIGVSREDMSVRIPPGTKVPDFRMVSFSLWPDAPDSLSVLADDMGGTYDLNNFKIGTYNTETGGYIECGNIMKIEPGRAYWFLARNGMDVTVSGVPVSVNHDIDVPLRYKPVNQNGWNMIGCPNDANYNWNDVQVLVYGAEGNIIYGPAAISVLDDDNPYISKQLWRWEGGAYISDMPVMERNSGYWVNVKQENVWLRFPVTAQQQTSGPQARSSAFSQRCDDDDDDDECPPRPMSGVTLSIVNEDGGTSVEAGVGCFIHTAGN
jgi:hypothetical protein